MDSKTESDFSIRRSNYFTTDSLGEGSFGAVVTVYNDDGEKFAMKAFDMEMEEIEDSDDDEYGEEVEFPTMDLGTLREISTLRMFSKIKENDSISHPGIMQLHDVAMVQGKMSMVMPKLSCNLSVAIKNKILNNKQKLSVAHMVLQAVAFLHKNDIIHRDIKCDNILLDDNMNPVLADFSLAKIFNTKLLGTTHSEGVGTATYKAPELYREEGYGLAADVYSTGVVILELFNGLLSFDRDKAALGYIDGIRQKMGGKPIPVLLKGLLDPDPSSRLTAEQALALPVFDSLKIDVPIEKVIHKVVHVAGMEDQTDNQSKKKKKTNKKKGKENKVGRNNKRQKTSSSGVEKLMAQLEFTSPITKIAAETYHKVSGAAVEDCVVLAGKLYEKELLSVSSVEDYLEDFDYDVYAVEELKIFKAMDYCLWV